MHDLGSTSKTALGLLLLFALVVLAGHSRIREWEKKAGLAMVVGSGLSFLVLGQICARIHLLEPELLSRLRPILSFGLAWVGLRLGAEFRVSRMEQWKEGTGRLVLLESGVALTALVLLIGGALVLLGRSPFGGEDQGAMRDAILLGACGAASAPTGARVMEGLGLIRKDRSELLRRVVGLDDVIAVVVLGLVTCWFRPDIVSAWKLPWMGWLLLMLGSGLFAGILLTLLVRTATSHAEEVAFLLGSTAFAAGFANTMGFSPLVLCWIAGAVVANAPRGRTSKENLLQRDELRRLERPIYMAFFVVVGASWNPSLLSGWLLLPLFFFARFLGKWIGARVSWDAAHVGHADAPLLEGEKESAWVGFALLPASVVSVVVIVAVEQLYPSAQKSGLITIVFGAAVCSEILFRIAMRVLHGKKASDWTSTMPVGGFEVELDQEPKSDPSPRVGVAASRKASAEAKTVPIGVVGPSLDGGSDRGGMNP